MSGKEEGKTPGCEPSLPRDAKRRGHRSTNAMGVHTFVPTTVEKKIKDIVENMMIKNKGGIEKVVRVDKIVNVKANKGQHLCKKTIGDSPLL